MYTLPTGEHTENKLSYAAAWENIGRRLEKIFTGYTFCSCNPGFKLEKRVVVEGKYRVLDSVTLSEDAAMVLLDKFEGRA